MSPLEVDVVLRHPERVTLEEVGALRLLEPYGVRPAWQALRRLFQRGVAL